MILCIKLALRQKNELPLERAGCEDVREVLEWSGKWSKKLKRGEY